MARLLKKFSYRNYSKNGKKKFRTAGNIAKYFSYRNFFKTSLNLIKYLIYFI